jgi:hypothetical protein
LLRGYKAMLEVRIQVQRLESKGRVVRG